MGDYEASALKNDITESGETILSIKRIWRNTGLAADSPGPHWALLIPLASEVIQLSALQILSFGLLILLYSYTLHVASSTRE